MRRFQVLDAWRTLAIVLMAAYHFLFDLYIFGVTGAETMFCTPLNVLERFICCSFILLAGASARFSRNNLRRGLTVLGAGLAVELGAAAAGQTIRWGVLMLLGASMVLYHILGKHLQKLPPAALGLGSLVLFFAARVWTEAVTVSVLWLYPLGFMAPGFFSADYFPLLPWFFLFLTGWFLFRLRPEEVREIRKVPVLTAMGRHSLLIYMLHQPVVYGVLSVLFR